MDITTGLATTKAASGVEADAPFIKTLANKRAFESELLAVVGA